MRISDWSSDVCSSDLGDVQVMTAGTGIMHSEWNAEDDLTHLFQIWIEPRQRNLKPRWDQAQFPKGDRANRLVPLASGEEAVRSDAPSTLLINQDATLYGALLDRKSTRLNSSTNAQ